MRDELALLLLEGLGLLEGALLHRRLLVGAHARDVLVELLRRGRRVHAPDPQATAGLVDEVDGLVGQEPVRDVAVGQVRRGDERLVGDLDRVELLVDLAQALEDLDGHRDRGLLDLHGLEAALEGGVLLDVLAVLVDGRGADGLELAAREHRLQDRRGVDRALGGARADQGVDLVDEQDDVAARADLLQDLLQSLLEVAAVAAAGDERAEVEGVELLVGQGDRHLVGDDLLGEALDDGGLADAGLADQDRVVLRAPRQDLHHALDFLLATDQRVELALAGELGEVASELVEDGRAARRPRRRSCWLPAWLGAPDSLPAWPDIIWITWVRTRAMSAPRSIRTWAATPSPSRTRPEQHVLGADVGVPELEGLAQGELQDLLGARREGGRPGRGVGVGPDGLFDLLAHDVEGHAQGVEGLGGHPFALADQSEQDVLGADEGVVEVACLLLGEHEYSPGTVSKSFEQWSSFVRLQ